MIHSNKILIVSILSIILGCFIKCSGPGRSDSGDPRGPQYAGATACISCHKNITDNYVHNSHFKTSAKAGYSYLRNTLKARLADTVNFTGDQQVIVNQQDDDVYQAYYRASHLIHAQKIELAFGSAEKAQTYAYWKDSQLYELPLTWLAPEKLWTNSPGFPVDRPYFTRVIPSRCMECHTSWTYTQTQRVDTFLQQKEIQDPSSIIYGIDCERCHGPAAQHVEFQQQHPQEKQAKFITPVRSLTRQQQLDMCGTCHSGDPIKLQSIFGFKPGDSLSKFYMYYNPASGEPDVHGMQLQLLSLSKCFRQSQLTCNTCHNPHQNTQNLNNTCMSCHQQVDHKTDITVQKSNCITCHMPERSSKSLDFNNASTTHKLQYMLRTHRIAVYPANEWQ